MMQVELVVKNARIIDWSQDFIGDVHIKDGIINEIGRSLNKECNTVDAQGLVLMPSFVDTHVHFRDPGFTYKEDIKSGSEAAVRGGYTMVNLMANTKPACSSMSTVMDVRNKAKAVNLVDVHQVVSITDNFDGKSMDHLNDVDDSVKVISEDGKDVMDSKVMMDAMFKAKEKGITVMCHCENHEISKVDMRLAENTMTWRNLTLGRYTGCNVHMAHVSTKEAMKYIMDAKDEGVNVTCEVTPHHIALVDDDYRVNPPIRQEEDVKFLIEAMKRGYVDCIATDHAPHTKEDKRNGAPGISGLDTAFSVSYTKLVKEGHMSLSKLSEMMSKRPAEILGCNKGQIKIGFEGDLVLVDTDKKYVIDSSDFASKGKNTPFNGMTVWGEVRTTIKGGRVVYVSK